MNTYLVAFGAAALMAAPSFAQSTSPNAEAAAGADAPKPTLEASRSGAPAATEPAAPKPTGTEEAQPNNDAVSGKPAPADAPSR